MSYKAGDTARVVGGTFSEDGSTGYHYIPDGEVVTIVAVDKDGCYYVNWFNGAQMLTQSVNEEHLADV